MKNHFQLGKNRSVRYELITEHPVFTLFHWLRVSNN